MAKLNALKIDAARESDGVEVHVSDGFYVRVRRTTYARYREFLQKRARGRARAALAGGEVDPEAAELLRPLIGEAVARHLIVDWRGLEDDAGHPIAFSVGKAVELLTDPALRDVLDVIVAAADNAALYRAGAVEVDAGNSQPPPAGT